MTPRVAARTTKVLVKVNNIPVCYCVILRLRPKEGAVGEVSTETSCRRVRGGRSLEDAKTARDI